MDKPLIAGFKRVYPPPDNSETGKRQGQLMFAVIESGGKQYKVQKDDVIFVEKLPTEKDSTVEFKVLALNGDDGLKTGAPYVEGATVTGKVLKNGKSRKITVFTYKAKKNEKRKMGHRQPYTKVQIDAINA
jgi:large subunit ribosomal protein L21